MNDSPKSKAHPGQSTQVAEESLMATADNLREYSVQLINMVRIPIYSGRVFRREAGRGSDLKPASIPR